jgi:hypothetical protein
MHYKEKRHQVIVKGLKYIFVKMLAEPQIGDKYVHQIFFCLVKLAKVSSPGHISNSNNARISQVPIHTMSSLPSRMYYISKLRSYIIVHLVNAGFRCFLKKKINFLELQDK